MAEKRPKETEEPDSNARNKRMSHFVVKMLNKILGKGIYQVPKSENKYGVIEQREEDIMDIQRGFRLLETRGVKCHLGWEDHGFVSVRAVDNQGETGTSDTTEVPILSSPVHVKKSVYTQVRQVQDQYGNDVTSMASTVIHSLNALALDLYRQEISRHISTQVKGNITHNEHICNIYLKSCSCAAFIENGQMQLCKHLYAALIMIRNLKDVDGVVIEALSWAPRVPAALKSFMNFNRNMNLPNYIINKVEGLQAIAHCASEIDMQQANSGELLRVLHGPSATGEVNPNTGYKKGGIVRKYALTDMADPYCPNIEFPKSLRSRRSEKGAKRGRKRMLDADDIPLEASPQEEEEKKIRITNPENECRELGENNVFYVTLPDDTPEELHDVGTTEEGRDTRDAENTLYNTKGFPSIVCGKCIDEGKGSPQLCYSPKELQSHIEREHPEKNLVCAFCYFNNTYTRYGSNKEFDDHLKQEH